MPSKVTFWCIWTFQSVGQKIKSGELVRNKRPLASNVFIYFPRWNNKKIELKKNGRKEANGPVADSGKKVETAGGQNTSSVQKLRESHSFVDSYLNVSYLSAVPKGIVMSIHALYFPLGYYGGPLKHVRVSNEN